MFEVGFSELLLICVIALIVLGPQRLPKLASQVGRWMGRARSMARQFRDQLEDEAHAVEFDLEDAGKPKSAANKSATDRAPANSIAPPASTAAVPAAIAAAESTTLATGIPPDDDFAHHDSPPDEQVAADATDGADGADKPPKA